jgi:NitT/TauT family transport system substrate-binding protein
VPGAYGETYFGLLALLESAGLNTSDVHIEYIEFTQVSALLGHKVDAVMGYVNNEAVQLQMANFPVRTFALSSTVRPLPLIGDGLAVRTSYLHSHGAAIKALITAIMRAENYIVTHPSETLDISKAYIPGLADPAAEAQAARVLAASIPLWQPISDNGYSAPSAWRAMAAFMLSHRFITKPANLSQSYSNSFLP